LESNQIRIHLSSVQEMQQNSTQRDLSKNHAKKEKKKDSEKNVKISIFRLYGHLNRPIDYLYMILALIGSIGSGISMPIQAYISSDLFSDVGNTSENIYSNIDKNIIYENIEKAFNRQINKLLTFGAVSFICTFLSVTFWNLVGQRDIHNFKYKYFSLLLRQEQGYFDKNNAFEFATKIQTQLDQVEEGIGGELGNILTSIIQCISGFVFAFITSSSEGLLSGFFPTFSISSFVCLIILSLSICSSVKPLALSSLMRLSWRS
jgi:ATP-binding cassette subfamily B (MDR/TAP) protein 1